MITAREAFDKLRRQLPAKTPTSGCSYGQWYVFVFVDKQNDPFGFDALYAVDKNSGETGSYSSGGELANLQESFDKSPIRFKEMVPYEKA